MATKTDSALLSEMARRLRAIQCNTCLQSGASGTIVANYQPLDCDGDPVGDPIDVMPVISVAKQDVAICNTQELADAINGGSTVLYNTPTIETASIDWALSDLNDISKVHSISISVVGTPGGTVDLGIGAGLPVMLPVGFTYTDTATTVFNLEYELTGFTGGARAIISTTQSA